MGRGDELAKTDPNHHPCHQTEEYTVSNGSNDIHENEVPKDSGNRLADTREEGPKKALHSAAR